ncbi:MAG TPA: hypothetical protein VFQ43_13455 [Nitrososphaera sp.]|nr:hypothetical protein [Nitrososphaera sp.]
MWVHESVIRVKSKPLTPSAPTTHLAAHLSRTPWAYYAHLAMDGALGGQAFKFWSWRHGT